MSKEIPIFLRAHTKVLKQPTVRRAKAQKPQPEPTKSQTKVSLPKWPEYALVFDCETTIDVRQTLTFGMFRFCRLVDKAYSCIEEGILYADDLPETNPDGLGILKRYISEVPADTADGYSRKMCLRSRSDFLENEVWIGGVGARAMIVGLNLPFDLTRIALDNRVARNRREGWSLVMFQDQDPDSGETRENPFRPRIIVTPRDSKAAFIRFAGISMRNKKTKKRFFPYFSGRFLDLRTFGWALRNTSYGLDSACEDFGLEGKVKDHVPTGQISLEEIEYCRKDVDQTVALLNAMRSEFDRHPIDLRPEKAYSPASIAKAYLSAMGLVQPSKKFNIPDDVLGSAMQAYYGGRAEARIRKTIVPVVHTDFMSEYTTVNTLLGLWTFLIAKDLRIEDATSDVRQLLADVLPDEVFKPEFWKRLNFFALVQPAGDVLPVRAAYNGTVSNIGINPLTSKDPIWYAGPDLIAATLLTGRPPSIVRALRLVPEGQQEGLCPVNLMGMIKIEPQTDDFFKTVIESRARVNSSVELPNAEKEAVGYFLKILASAGSYGLFVEINPERVGTDAKTGKPARAKILVCSGEFVQSQTSETVEKPGPWYCPPFAALIAAGGRLLLALLEQTVTASQGSYLFCDTDSMAVVSSKHGELVPCVGGSHRLPDGSEAINALSWEDVSNIVQQFEQLNPYDRRVVQEPILKIEKVNYDPEGTQRQIYGYAIAAKRYALFTFEEES
jgi:hypothetical protein